MPTRTIKTNYNIKTKIEHGGIRNRYAKFELVVRPLIHYTKQLSALEGGYVWSQYSGSYPTSKQEVQTIYIYIYIASLFITKFFTLVNSNLKKKFERPNTIVQGTVLGMDLF